MKLGQPLPLKKKYFKEIEKEINKLFYEILFRPVVRILDVPEKELKNAKAPLYIKRKVLNASEILAWAKKQGFPSTLKASDLHVTICRSRAGVDSRTIEKKQNNIYIDSKLGRRVAPLGNDGALVLFFQSAAIESRWHQMIEKHGASWDYDSYHPHITISYDGAHIDLESIKPYDGAIHLGEEIHARPIDGWRGKIKELLNAADPLESAIRRGTVYYEAGKFYGQFNSGISKRLRELGAKYNKHTKAWTYSGALPAELSIANTDAEMRFQAAKDRLITVLDSIDVDKINDITEIPNLFDKTIEEMEADYQATMKKITIPPQLTQAQKGILAAEYGQNLDKYIKDWTDETILELREKVKNNAFSGRRSRALLDEIQHLYGVSKRKAEFLARQETSLLMSKFRETRYKDAGSTKYKWSGSMDEREREDHKLLEGDIIFWDSPPVTNRKTGARNHAGEDYGCRCVAIPIFD